MFNKEEPNKNVFLHSQGNKSGKHHMNFADHVIKNTRNQRKKNYILKILAFVHMISKEIYVIL